MTTKTTIYLAILGLALLCLAIGGWTVNGVKALIDQARKTLLRPRVA